MDKKAIKNPGPFELQLRALLYHLTKNIINMFPFYRFYRIIERTHRPKFENIMKEFDSQKYTGLED
jgi:hypothetical protein